MKNFAVYIHQLSSREGGGLNLTRRAFSNVSLQSAGIFPGKQADSCLSFGLPLDEDLKAGSISSTLRNQCSNVPPQVRKAISESRSSYYTPATKNESDIASRWTGSITNFLTLIGKGPVELSENRQEYCSRLSLVRYGKGMKSAYHWPRVLVPRSVAARCRENLRVDQIDADRSVLLLDQLLGRTSVIFCFSGNDFSAPSTGIKAWKSRLERMDSIQVLEIHMTEGWLSRRTHPLTRQILRSFRPPEMETRRDHERTFLYRGKMDRDLILDFHLYNKALPSILLVDSKGFIRWHAVGLPTEESVFAMNALLQKLLLEKQY